jgi:hypothetical protein
VQETRIKRTNSTLAAMRKTGDESTKLVLMVFLALLLGRQHRQTVCGNRKIFLPSAIDG